MIFQQLFPYYTSVVWQKPKDAIKMYPAHVIVTADGAYNARSVAMSQILVHKFLSAILAASWSHTDETCTISIKKYVAPLQESTVDFT
jgi:hypothetical protein